MLCDDDLFTRLGVQRVQRDHGGPWKDKRLAGSRFVQSDAHFEVEYTFGIHQRDFERDVWFDLDRLHLASLGNKIPRVALVLVTFHILPR